MSPLRHGGLFLVLAVAGVAAPARPLQGTSLAARIESDCITVTAQGLTRNETFALVFSRRAGSIVGWYDLDRDPKMQANLCAHGETNGFALFENRLEMVVDGKELALHPGPAEEFSVTESSDVRIVIQAKGRLVTSVGELPGEKRSKAVLSRTGGDWRGPERPIYSTRFTVYPTGRIYIRHVLEFTGRPEVFTSNRMILGTAPVRDLTVLNDIAGREEAFLEPAGFILHHGSAGEFASSALMVSASRRYRTDWLGQLMMLDDGRGWVRSAFTVGAGRYVPQPGPHVWNFMLQIEPANVDAREAARLYASDYIEPARLTFPDGRAAADADIGEDPRIDGFAEGLGCYLVNAEGREDVEVRFDAGMQSRFFPAFELRGWKGATPANIVVDDSRRRASLNYNARREGKKLLIQYLGVLSPGTHVLRVERARPGDEN
jgi:hypothetical protein